MEDKFYTIDQVAAILGMHHKTIRKFITEGKLKANKVGKQWRITGHDLSNFTEDNGVSNKRDLSAGKIDFSTNNVEVGYGSERKINIATVVDINEVNMDAYRKLSNMLLAVMNSKDAKMNDATINLKHYPEGGNVKVMLWGSVEFTKEMLDFIEVLINSKES